MTGGDWLARAACRGSDPRLFDPLDDTEIRVSGAHPSGHERIRLAISVCSLCPVRAECGRQADALRAIGVWAARYRKLSGPSPSAAPQRGKVRKKAA